MGTSNLAESQVKIEQALFGYRHGHEMIVSSSPAWAEISSLVLPFTDRPTPASRSSQQSWLTAFPLREPGLFYLGKSWSSTPAEHLRPGAVWTHSLIFQVTAMTAMRDLRTLLTLFRRPTLSVEVAKYQEPILLDPMESWATPATDGVPEGVCAATLEVLYTRKASDSVVVEWLDQAWDADLTVVSLWNAQWPALRAALSFATYSSGAKSPVGRPFDIVLAAPHELKNTRVSNVVQGDSHGARSPGINFLARCVLRDEPELEGYRTAFRDELDLSSEAVGSAIVAATVLERTHACDAATTVHELAQGFPTPQQASGFKRFIVGPEGLLTASAGDLAAMEAIASEGSGALDLGTLDVDRRMATLWESSERPIELAERLRSGSRSDEALAVATALIYGVPAKSVESVFQHESMIALLAWLGPSSASRLLRAHPAVTRAVASRMESLPDLRSFGDEIANIAIRRPADEFLPFVGNGKPLRRRSLVAAMESALRSVSPVGEGWILQLFPDQKHLSEWLKETTVSPDVALSAILRYLDPGAPEVKRLGWKFWTRYIRPSEETGQFSEIHHFLLAVAFALGWYSSGSLGEAVYDAVYRNQPTSRS